MRPMVVCDRRAIRTHCEFTRPHHAWAGGWRVKYLLMNFLIAMVRVIMRRAPQSRTRHRAYSETTGLHEGHGDAVNGISHLLPWQGWLALVSVVSPNVLSNKPLSEGEMRMAFEELGWNASEWYKYRGGR